MHSSITVKSKYITLNDECNSNQHINLQSYKFTTLGLLDAIK